MRKQRSDAKARSKTVSISIQCCDACNIKLVFLIEEDDPRSRSKSPEAAPIPDHSDPLKEFGQKFLNLTSSPRVGRKILKTMSEKMMVGKQTEPNTSDLFRCQSLVGVSGTVTM